MVKENSDNFETVKPKELHNIISFCADMDHPLMIHGAPGAGKTTIVEAAAKKRGVPCITIALTLFDPVDLRGLPVVSEDRKSVTWVPLGELPTGGEGFINFDEINTADPSVMAASMRLVLNRQIGEYKIPEGWRLFATGNRIEDGASANKMPTALADRFAHVTLETDTDNWVDWAVDNDMPQELIAFIKFRPDLLSNFSAENTVNATPRGWESVGRAVNTGQPNPTVLHNFISGRVGRGPAIELKGFTKVWKNMPDINKILTGKDTDGSVIEDPATKWAVAVALAFRMRPDDTITHICNYLDGMGSEFTRMATLMAIRRDNKIAETKQYIETIQKQLHAG